MHIDIDMEDRSRTKHPQLHCLVVRFMSTDYPSGITDFLSLCFQIKANILERKYLTPINLLTFLYEQVNNKCMPHQYHTVLHVNVHEAVVS